MKLIMKYLFLLLTGGGIYYLLEIAARGHSHPAMVVVGGLCFLVCGIMNEVMDWQTPLPEQMLICAAIITVIEFAAGLLLNVWLGLNIWDYSRMPLNIMGQICVPFMILWYFLSAAGIIVDDYLRYWFFEEEKPHYRLWRRKC